MKKVLLASISHKEEIESTSLISLVPPLDLGYCASILRKKFNVSILDANALQLTISEQIDRILCKKPDFIIFSAKIYSIPKLQKICKKVREKLKNVKIVVIGNYASTNAKDLLKDIKEVDFAILGEAEAIIDELLLSTKKNYSKIANIAYRKDRKIIVNKERKWIKNLNSLNFPARDLMPHELYYSPYSKNTTAIRAGRGCPFSCSFCDIHHLFGKNYRMRSSKDVVNEVNECFEKYDVNFVSFLDHTFTFDKKWIKEFCNLIIKKKLHTKVFWSCLTRVDLINEEMLLLMKHAGCIQIGIGIESAKNIKLKQVKKGITFEQIKNAIRLMRKIGILSMGYCIIGFPDDSIKDVLNTKTAIFELNPDFLQLSFATPLPGTNLYKECDNKKIILAKSLEEFNFLNKPIIKNKKLPSKKLKELHKEILKEFYFNPKKIIGLTKFFIFNSKLSYFHVLKMFNEKIVGFFKRIKN